MATNTFPVLQSSRIVVNGRTVVVEHVYDPEPDLSYLEDMNQSQYDQAANLNRLQDYRAERWHALGIVVRVSWEGYEVGYDALWGVESDSDPSYLREIEAQCIEEAMRAADVEMARMRLALCGHPNPSHARV
jgi:hypothetical protein